MRQEWIDRPEAGTALGVKLLTRIALGFGRTAARLLLYPITAYFLLRRGPERRASRDYLARVTGRSATLGQIARHIHVFAAVTLDRVFLLTEKFRRFEIRTHGLEELRRTWSKRRGLLLYGAHLGSFDVLRVLGDFREEVKVRVVIDTGQNAQLSAILNALNPALAASIIHARQDGTTTALAIKEALEEAAVVTMLADRARPGNAVVTADFLGKPAQFPAAPWQLAAVLKTPVLLCFGLYRGGNRYDVIFEPFADAITLRREDREADLRAVVQRFADRLTHHARSAPYNWFNFYDFWQPHDPSASGAPHDRDALRARER